MNLKSSFYCIYFDLILACAIPATITLTETVLDSRFVVNNVLSNECDAIGNYWLAATGPAANQGFVVNIGCPCTFKAFSLKNYF